jgi:acyl-CoA thioester hydrolase
VPSFEKILTAGWRDMDYNSHMANTAYLDRAADVRMMYFAENGFTADEMLRLRIGPVVMKDEIEYFREVRLLQEIRVGLATAGLAPDGSRFILRNEFSHADGTRCASVTSTLGWLDLNQRKLTAPPDALRKALEALPRLEGFRELRSSVSGAKSTG